VELIPVLVRVSQVQFAADLDAHSPANALAYGNSLPDSSEETAYERVILTLAIQISMIPGKGKEAKRNKTREPRRGLFTYLN
jgi:hypothetical protein